MVGTHVTGVKDGKPREIFSYQRCDAEDTMKRFGLQPVAWQTGFNPVAAMELLAEDGTPAIMDRDGIHHATVDIVPGTAFA